MTNDQQNNAELATKVARLLYGDEAETFYQNFGEIALGFERLIENKEAFAMLADPLGWLSPKQWANQNIGREKDWDEMDELESENAELKVEVEKLKSYIKEEDNRFKIIGESHDKYADENDKLRAEVEKLKNGLEHICEYWNGSRTDGAMSDALDVILAEAQSLLDGKDDDESEMDKVVVEALNNKLAKNPKFLSETKDEE